MSILAQNATRISRNPVTRSISPRSFDVFPNGEYAGRGKKRRKENEREKERDNGVTFEREIRIIPVVIAFVSEINSKLFHLHSARFVGVIEIAARAARVSDNV